MKLIPVVLKLFDKVFHQFQTLIRVGFERLPDDLVKVASISVIGLLVALFEDRLGETAVNGCMGRLQSRCGGQQEGYGEKSANGNLEGFNHKK